MHSRVGTGVMALSSLPVSLARLGAGAAGGVRNYARWTHRTPARTLLQLPNSGSSLQEERLVELDPRLLESSRRRHADKLAAVQGLAGEPRGSRPRPRQESPRSSDVPDAADQFSKQLVRVDSAKIKQKRESALESKMKQLGDQKVFDENGDIIYEKLNNNDGRINPLLINLKSKKRRANTGLVLVEGRRLVIDGIEAKCPLKYLIFSRSPDLNALKPYLPANGVKIYKMSYKEIELWSDVETPSGIFGVFSMPTPENIKRKDEPIKLNIICDNVRIPNNLGAILRAAVGVGCENVYLTKGCVDMWEPKVVRTAAGAHFSLPIYSGLDWEQLPKLLDQDSSIFIADNNLSIELNHKYGQNTNPSEQLNEHIDDIQLPVLPYYTAEYSALKSVTLIVGGETEGISEDSYRFAASRNGLRVNIPLQKGVDSLNTGMATAVIAFEIKKQLLEARGNDNMRSAVIK